jgi:hypothetical protein
MSAAEIVKLFQKWMNLHGPLLGGLSYRTEPLQGYSPSIEYHNEALCKNPRQIQFLTSDRVVRQQNTDFQKPEVEFAISAIMTAIFLTQSMC